MNTQEWSRLWHNDALDVSLMQARYVRHAYPRHSHDYYVICLIEEGNQSFTLKGVKHTTPPGGLIFINPDEAHTGEPADRHGFRMRTIYPTISAMESALAELASRRVGPPTFKPVRVDDRWARANLLALHTALEPGQDVFAGESRFLWTIAQLIQRYTEQRPPELRLGSESSAIARVRRYIEERHAQPLRLAELSALVSLSPYYLLRSFSAVLGMPPHAYLETVRIRRAQQLIAAGWGLADVAVEVGFSSQSHLTRSFKRIIGVTPGDYASQRGRARAQRRYGH